MKRWTSVARQGWTEPAIEFFDMATRRECSDRKEYNKRSIDKEDRIDKFQYNIVGKCVNDNDRLDGNDYIPDDEDLYDC